MDLMEFDEPSTKTTVNSKVLSNDLVKRLPASHSHSESNKSGETADESSSRIKDMLFVSSKFVGSWMNCSGTSNSNPSDLYSTENNIKNTNNPKIPCPEGLEIAAGKFLSNLMDDSTPASIEIYEQWYKFVDERMLWKKLIERRVNDDKLWRRLAERNGWIKYLHDENHSDQTFYRNLFLEVTRTIKNLVNNWRNGTYNLQKINCRSEKKLGVYCLQYDDEKIASGCRDNTIKIWDRKTLKCIKVLKGHESSVLSLQFDDKIIIAGCADGTVHVWDLNSGDRINSLNYHSDSVLHVKFYNGILVTASKDRLIAVWEIKSPKQINLRRVLVGHKEAVNAVEFEDKYTVSISADRTIKVWNTSTWEFVRSMKGHKRGVTCFQYRYPLIITGSSDKNIKIWHVETGQCLRTLKGHKDLVRCVRFNSKYVVSGCYDGKIKVWDLVGALNPHKESKSLCLHTLKGHTGRVFRIQFDDFQIVSSSDDDTILIWDFLNDKQEDVASDSNTYDFGNLSITYDNQDDDASSTSTLINQSDDDFVMI